MTTIVISFGLRPELVERIQKTAPDATVRVLGQEQAAPLSGERLLPPRVAPLTPKADLEAAVSEADIVFGWWGGDLRDFLSTPAKAPNLRWVQITQVGGDNIDLDLIRGGISFTTSGDLAAIPMGEFIMSYLLVFAKDWPALIRGQEARQFPRYLPAELRGATVGIVGYGNIGRETARLAKAFGCRVIASRRSATARVSDDVADEIVPATDLDYLLAESDYLILAAPLTPATRGLIGAEQLRRMKPTAYLINVARGPMVDEPALVAALKDGTIAGAALDVYNDPLGPDSELWSIPNLVLTPHVSSFTEMLNSRVTDIFCENLRRFRAGEPLKFGVEPDRGY